MFSTIVSAEELRRHTGDPAWVTVDCRHVLADFSAGRKLYQAGHIPSAYFASVEDDLAGTRTGKNGRHPLPKSDEFVAFLRGLGINDDTQVVAYDAGGDMFAARFWFLLKHIGHDASAVLDGGFAAWTAAGLRIETAEPRRPGNGTISARVRSNLAVGVDDVLRSVEQQDMLILDARGADRFAGENETLDPVAGHIPGAVNRPFRTNFDERGRFKPADELRAEFEALGQPPEQIVHQCGSGVSAAVNLLAMEIAGQKGARLYPGSWSEWCADPTRPMITSQK